MTIPPENLMDWPKGQLVREVQRLRAIVFEHARSRGDAPRSDGGAIVDDPHARGGAILDARNAILMDQVDVSLVDAQRDEGPVVALALAGRITMRPERATQLYLFGVDGAAAIVTELIGLAERAGPRFAHRVAERLDEMP